MKWSNSTKGILLGFIAIVLFSATLPATRMIALTIDPFLIASGRILCASFIAIAVLLYRGERLPEKQYFKSLIVVCIFATIAFPLGTTWALQAIPSTHGILAIAILPILTSCMAVARTRERVSLRSWIGCIVGTVILLLYSFSQGVGEFSYRDLVLLFATIAAAIGFAEGGYLAREIGGWRVISWSLLLAGIPALAGVILTLPQNWQPIDSSMWASWIYLSAVCSYGGYIPWFQGMALASISDVSRLQLLQPFLALLFAHILVDEGMNVIGIILLVLVSLTILICASPTLASSQEH